MRYGYPGKLATRVRGRLKRLAGGRHARRAAARPRHVGRRLRRAARASRRALVPAAAARRGCRARDDPADRRRRAGRVLPRRRPHVRPPGSARPPHVPGRAAPADAGRADRLRPLQGRRRAELAVGSAGRASTAGAARSSCAARRRATAGSSTSSSSCATTSARAWATSRASRSTPPNELAMSLALWPGQPRSIAVRPTSIAFAEELPLPALMLVGDRGRAGVARRAAAHVQRGPHAALDGYRSRAQVPADQAAAARRRLRAGGVRGVVDPEAGSDRLSATLSRTEPPSAVAPQSKWRMAESSRRRDEPLPPAARGQPGRLVPVGRGGARAARAEDKPILLSIGYSACHWCHVMAHESFEDRRRRARR